jgi:hypothetical protein
VKSKSILFGAVVAVTASLSTPSQAYGYDFWLVECSKNNGSFLWMEMTYSSKSRDAAISRCYADGGSPTIEKVF